MKVCRVSTVLFGLVFLFCGRQVQAQPCKCAEELNFVVRTVEENYIGGLDKIKTNPYRSLLDSLRREAGQIGNANCLPVLRRYTAFYNDPHLSADYKFPLDTLRVRALFASTEKVSLTEADLRRYLDKPGRDPLEGIWEDDSRSYRIGVIKDGRKGRDFVGFVLSADGAFWTPGQVKLEINKKGKGYRATYYLLEHDTISLSFKTAGGTFELSDGYGTWYKQYPKVKASAVPVAAASTAEEAAFNYKLLDKETGVLTLPSFRTIYKPVIDSIIQANRETILRTRNLIIDVRDNFGGTTGAFEAIIPFLYTQPIVKDANSIWATDANIKAFEVTLDWPDQTEQIKQETQQLVSKLKQQRNQVVTFPGDTVKMDKVRPFPVKVAIITNENTASTAELFILQARQSRKVAIFGQPTMGGVDYLDVNEVETTCGLYSFRYPLTRNDRILEKPTAPSRIPPDVSVPNSAAEWVLFVRDYLAKHQ
jgi:hypothetical protein